MAKRRPAKTKKIKVRRRWVINPRTRIKESAKVYSRPKAKRKFRKRLKEEQ